MIIEDVESKREILRQSWSYQKKNYDNLKFIAKSRRNEIDFSDSGNQKKTQNVKRDKNIKP